MFFITEQTIESCPNGSVIYRLCKTVNSEITTLKKTSEKTDVTLSNPDLTASRAGEVFCASVISNKLRNTKQTNTSDMKQQLLGENLPALLALKLMSQPLPTCTLIPKSLGLSEIEIKKRYKEVNVLPGIRQDEKVIEARVSGKTLSFQLRDDFCVAAYCFDDRDDH